MRAINRAVGALRRAGLVRVSLVAVLGGGAVLGMAFLGSAQDEPPPRDLREICLSCHEDFDANLEGKTLHDPMTRGECTSCHDPHASEDPKFLLDTERKVCASCHEAFEQSLDVTNLHTPVAQGECSACHEPHGSSEEHFLTDKPEAMCLNCHKMGDIAPSEHVHAPVSEGQCLTCHDAHGSNHRGNLVGDMRSVCLDCHNDAGSLATAHTGLQVNDSQCQLCHGPHSSDSGKLLKAVVHFPVAEGECGACHEITEAGQPGALTGTMPDLCFSCHNRADFARTNVHQPVSDGKCTDCHNVHASEHQKLLHRTQDELCANCHSEVAAHIAKADVVHGPVLEGKCTACHEAHAGDHGKLTKGDKFMELCETCHERHPHPLEVELDPEKFVLNENSKVILDEEGKIVCLSCHSPHATKEKQLLHYSKDRELCIQCHKM